jgi:prolyl oligopeptidase
MKIPGLAGAILAGMMLATASAQDALPRADDPFRGLEEAGRPETEAFYRGEGAATRAALDRIAGRAGMLARIRALSESGTTITSIALTEGARVFYLRLGPRDEVPVLCTRESVMAAERVLLDPRRFTPGASSAAIDWFVPSPDGRHVAYGVSLGGSEDSVLRVLATGTGSDLPIEIDRARFNANLAWNPDGKSFYYARIPEGGRGARRYANVRMYRHVLGRDASRDEIVFAPGVGGARDIPEFVHPSLHVPAGSRYAYAIARDGARREIAVHVAEQRDLAEARPRWRKLIGYDDEVLAILGWKEDLYLLSHRNAPRHRVLLVKGSATDLKAARIVVPEGDTVIQEMALARDALYLRTMVAGVDRLERVPLGFLGAKAAEFVRTPFDNAIAQLLAQPRAEGALLRLQGWIEAPKIVQVDAKGNIRDTRVQPPPTADFTGMDEVRLYAPAADGSKIPVTLVYRKTTTLTGANPTLLTGYGSYGVTISPAFDAAGLAWLERGGIFAVAHVRGGGEYGEPWHEAGKRAAKINAIRDFIAVSDFLVSYGFTNPRRLAIMGTGEGGILVGGAIVRRPELYAAAVARAPVMDVTRYESMPGGPASVPEFGSGATAEGLESLRAISAYHLVKEGTPYPAVMLIQGLNDAYVERWQPGKMAARLQSATSSGKPVLLRVDAAAGHGPGAARAQHDEDLADIYSFLLWQMGDAQFQPPPPPPPPEPWTVPQSPAPAQDAAPETPPPAQEAAPELPSK